MEDCLASGGVQDSCGLTSHFTGRPVGSLASHRLAVHALSWSGQQDSNVNEEIQSMDDTKVTV